MGDFAQFTSPEGDATLSPYSHIKHHSCNSQLMTGALLWDDFTYYNSWTGDASCTIDRGLLHHPLMPKTISDSPQRYNQTPAPNQPGSHSHFSHEKDTRDSLPWTMPKYGLVCLKN